MHGVGSVLFCFYKPHMVSGLWPSVSLNKLNKLPKLRFLGLIGFFFMFNLWALKDVLMKWLHVGYSKIIKIEISSNGQECCILI